MFLSLLLATSTLVAPASAAALPKVEYRLKLEDYAIATQDYRFPSGLRILFQEDHTQPIVSVTNWIDRGSVYDGTTADGKSTEGIAHVVEHLAFRARHEGLPKNWDVIQQLGGVLNASTSREWTNYMTVAPVDAAAPLLRIEALRLHNGLANVTEEDVEAEKAIVRNELRMGYESGSNGSPEIRTAFVHIPKLVYPQDHIYRNTTIGNHETISNIKLADAQRYVRENYRPEFSTIAVVGDFKLEGGQGIKMIFDAFDGVEHLLMAADDAAAFQKLTDAKARNDFLDKWASTKLEPFIRETAAQDPKPRVDCSQRVEPPPLFDKQVMKVKGMVDRPTAIAAWSLPSGYCPDDANMNLAANLLTNYIYRTLDPQYDPLSQEQEIDGAGCFVDTDRRGSVLLCFVQQGKLSKDTPERLLDRVADALYLQWQPIDAVFKPFFDNSLTEAKLSNMASILGMTDNVASLYGRSFFVSQHAHYRGSPRFFSESIEESNVISFEAAKAVAQKYITRDRMARLVIEPIDEEERERLEAGASEADKSNSVSNEHRAKDDKGRQLFDTTKLTADAIKGVTVVPDLAKARRFTLDNGLEVVILNHGEAPLVKMGLQVAGSNAVAPRPGIDSLATALYSTARTSNLNPMENPLAIAGDVYRDGNLVYAGGSSGNIDALLHKMRQHVTDYDWRMADKSQRIRSWSNGARGDGTKPETWATRVRSERLFPGHPYGNWMSSAEYESLSDATLTELKEWTATKWQPQNAVLVIVGKVDEAAAEKAVRTFFDSWAYEGTGTPGTLAPPPAPTSRPERQVLLFDKGNTSQSKLQLSCQLAFDGEKDRPQTEVLGELFTFFAFERLREQAGLTYGAYAFPRRFWGNSTELILSSVIQNSGVGFGIKTFFDIVEEGAAGKIDTGLVSTNKWNVARTSVTNLQSSDQMLSALLAPGRGNLDTFYGTYGDNLANVNVAGIQGALQTCKGHEIVTVVGPVESIKPQLDEMKIPYEVVDWEALHVSTLDKKAKKAWDKSKAKEKAAEAKKAAESGAGK